MRTATHSGQVHIYFPFPPSRFASFHYEFSYLVTTKALTVLFRKREKSHLNDWFQREKRVDWLCAQSGKGARGKGKEWKKDWTSSWEAAFYTFGVRGKGKRGLLLVSVAASTGKSFYKYCQLPLSTFWLNIRHLLPEISLPTSTNFSTVCIQINLKISVFMSDCLREKEGDTHIDSVATLVSRSERWGDFLLSIREEWYLSIPE